MAYENFNSIEKKQLFERKVAYLESPNKRGGVTPESLQEILQIKGNENILDLGAGTGYLSIPIAQKTNGTVYALDYDSNMLSFMKKRIAENKIVNVHPLKGNIESIPLPYESVDIVIASLVLHETKHLNLVLNEIKHVLKPGGILVCIELEKQEKDHHNHPRIDILDMKKEIKNTDLIVTDVLNPTNETYIIMAEKMNQKKSL
ncbi:class I SAM-dependent methyltransferase [Halalkalibacter okhensis]|uniref:Methyltransferase domain-containing protein n=1 Tax=Halalkalibacter okhensis TaxID=333138 RepID=A0A0B0IGR1_9BACI|nr:class I SAM-dependent methyltransferase [Halalkalibacter okhensis]KHF39249.1 hypothetical protein LQ50_16210 [Halalkalibacter okhensis]